jgi:type VI secretion system secreted protein VgrG
MKPSIWNILTIAVLLLWLILVISFLVIFTKPYSVIESLRIPTLPPTVEIPTATATLRKFPPTWTPTIAGTNLVPTMTMQPTGTDFTLPTFTPTATSTRTMTKTPKNTRTPTPTISE